jgi:ADP-heptose:LPS heptosyltransferase
VACFVAAVGPRLWRGHGPKILFQRHGGIGDIICSFPAVLALREKYPGATIIYRCWHEFAAIVRMGQVADQVVPSFGYPFVPSRCEGLFDLALRPQPTGQPRVHVVDDFCRILGLTPRERQPRLIVPTALATSVGCRLQGLGARGPLVGFHTGPSWKVREWTTTGWEELVAWLVHERHTTVLQLGTTIPTGGEPASIARIAGAVDWVGKLSLDETVASIQACDLFVGIDSGLLHIAGAVGTPCVGLFGPIDPALRLPPETPSIGVVADVPCLGCHHRSPQLHWQDGCPYDIQCMRTLSVERVTAACDRLLGLKNANARLRN